MIEVGLRVALFVVASSHTCFRGTYSSTHTTGSKDFLLKAELLRAISDCGVEHPSVGRFFLIGQY